MAAKLAYNHRLERRLMNGRDGERMIGTMLSVCARYGIVEVWSEREDEIKIHLNLAADGEFLRVLGHVPYRKHWHDLPFDRRDSKAMHIPRKQNERAWIKPFVVIPPEILRNLNRFRERTMNPAAPEHERLESLASLMRYASYTLSNNNTWPDEVNGAGLPKYRTSFTAWRKHIHLRGGKGESQEIGGMYDY
ncbi:MAG: hypothetical protein JSS66_15480 [Armatimonadetes bacterium]|nr:hypothetical protein [Armatimonadota bacterium]